MLIHQGVKPTGWRTAKLSQEIHSETYVHVVEVFDNKSLPKGHFPKRKECIVLYTLCAEHLLHLASGYGKWSVRSCVKICHIDPICKEHYCSFQAFLGNRTHI